MAVALFGERILQTISTPQGHEISSLSTMYFVWSAIIRGLPPLPLRWCGFEITVKFSSSIKSSIGRSSLCHDSETVMSCIFFSLINVLNWPALLYKLRGFTFKITGRSKACINLFDLGMGFKNLFVFFLSFLCLIRIVTLVFLSPLSTRSDLGAASPPLEKNHCFLSHYLIHCSLIEMSPH